MEVEEEMEVEEMEVEKSGCGGNVIGGNGGSRGIGASGRNGGE